MSSRKNRTILNHSVFTIQERNLSAHIENIELSIITGLPVVADGSLVSHIEQPTLQKEGAFKIGCGESYV